MKKVMKFVENIAVYTTAVLKIDKISVFIYS